MDRVVRVLTEFFIGSLLGFYFFTSRVAVKILTRPPAISEWMKL
jgi:hypothetical protein